MATKKKPAPKPAPKEPTRIEALMAERRLTVDQVAERSEPRVTKPNVEKAVAGDGEPTERTLAGIAHALGTTVEDLSS